MTTSEWLAWAINELTAQNISSAKIDSHLILEHVLGETKATLLSRKDYPLKKTELETANQLLGRRLSFEPMAYILGYKEFYGFTFKTDPRALIPRWESECIIETAIDWLKKQTKSLVIAEIGTGSGILILTLAKLFPQHTFVATEVSFEALDLAQENAQLLEIENVTFIRGDLARPLLQDYREKVDLLIANLPYIPSGLLTTLDSTVTYFEPNIALEGGETGLELYAKFFPQIKQVVSPQALILCEHDHDQGESMQQLARQTFPDAKIKTLQDYMGHDRVLYCQIN